MVHDRLSIISPAAQIADDVEIGHFCIVEDDVVIGPRTVIKNNVEIRNGTRIGSGCYLDSGVKISGDAEIGDNVVLRYDAIIARGCRIGNRTYISPQVMFQNLDHQREPIGGARIGEDCFIGTNVCFGVGLVIADRTVIGAKSLVTKSISESGWIYIGVPARRHKKAPILDDKNSFYL